MELKKFGLKDGEVWNGSGHKSVSLTHLSTNPTPMWALAQGCWGHVVQTAPTPLCHHRRHIPSPVAGTFGYCNAKQPPTHPFALQRNQSFSHKVVYSDKHLLVITIFPNCFWLSAYIKPLCRWVLLCTPITKTKKLEKLPVKPSVFSAGSRPHTWPARLYQVTIRKD